MLPSVPSTGVFASERLLTNLTVESKASVRVHVPLYLISGEEFFLANVTFKETLPRVYIVVPSQISQPLEGFSTDGTEVDHLPINQLRGDIALLPHVFPLQTDVMVQAILVAIVLSTFLTAQHFARECRLGRGGD